MFTHGARKTAPLHFAVPFRETGIGSLERISMRRSSRLKVTAINDGAPAMAGAPSLILLPLYSLASRFKINALNISVKPISIAEVATNAG